MPKSTSKTVLRHLQLLVVTQLDSLRGSCVVQGGDSLIVRVDSDQAPGRPGSADHHHAVAQPPSVIMNSDMEAFGNRLSAIVNAPSPPPPRLAHTLPTSSPAVEHAHI